MPLPGVCQNIMETRHKLGGYGSPANPVNFFNQSYQQLKQHCLHRGLRYIDEIFPPNNNSIGLGLLSPTDLARVEWQRPARIAPNPDFIVDGISRFDFGQGVLGNCWFLASIGALTFQKNVLRQVVPCEQSFRDNYCGLFHFRFWRFGKWLDVVIDDKLPTINNKLIFVHSKDQNEFWPALLEKAYAKVCGSYVDMRSGTPIEAMMDFTGGVHICISLSDAPSNMWELMLRAGQSKSLMSCGTRSGETSANTVLKNGLVEGHAYAVTGVKQTKSQGQLVNLVRLWNPWGKGEWNGDWSDRSPLWQTVCAQDRELCLSVHDDGEFWMDLNDFCKFFNELSICSMTPNFLDGNSSCQWKSTMFAGRWVSGATAGGCVNNKESFWTNPQFRVKINGQNCEKDGDKNTVVSLMQKPDKWNRRMVQNVHIGFSIFEVTDQYKSHEGKFTANFFISRKPVAVTKTYVDSREVMEFLTLKPGEYVIVPSTFSPNVTASFNLTIQSKAEAHAYDNSVDHTHEPVQTPQFKLEKQTSIEMQNPAEDESKRTFFSENSDKHGDVNSEKLQKLLNEKILKGDLKSGGFTIDACRSMVALMDTSITGKLDDQEFISLWKKVVTYKDTFFHTDVDRTGTLSVNELRNAFITLRHNINDDMFNLMTLRYGDSSGHITLENFISLMLRLDRTRKMFQQLSDGKALTLRESEWMHIFMYT